MCCPTAALVLRPGPQMHWTEVALMATHTADPSDSIALHPKDHVCRCSKTFFYFIISEYPFYQSNTRKKNGLQILRHSRGWIILLWSWGARHQVYYAMTAYLCSKDIRNVTNEKKWKKNKCHHYQTKHFLIQHRKIGKSTSYLITAVSSHKKENEAATKVSFWARKAVYS